MENGFQKIAFLIRRHWAGLALAVIFGLLMATPFLVSRIALGDSFQAVEPRIMDDEAFYLSRIQEVRDGHPLIGSSYLAEHKDKPPQQLFIPEFILAQLSIAVGLPTPQARIILGILLAGATFLMAYAAAYRVACSRAAAILIASVLFFGSYPELMLRPVSPQFNFIFWWFAFMALWDLVERGYSGWRAVVGALAVGVLFYIYPYYWTWFGVMIAIMLAGLWWIDRTQFKGWFVSALGAGVAGIGYVVMSYQAAQLPEYAETMSRLGMITTHFPSGIKILAIAGVGYAFLFLAFRRGLIGLNRQTLFWIAGLSASIIAVNQHVLTGVNFEFSSHYRMQTVAFLIVLLGFLWRHSGNMQRILLRLAAVGALAICIVGMRGFGDRMIMVVHQSPYQQDYAPVFQWLREHAAPDAVVYANTDLSDWIPVYTPQNVVFSSNARLFLISDRELEQRFAVQHFFDAVDEKLVRSQERALVGVRYLDQAGHVGQQNKLRALFGREALPVPEFPPSEVTRIADEVRQVQGKSFELAIRPYRADYFVWDALRDPDWKLAEQTWLAPVFHSGQFIIFAPAGQFAHR